MGVESKTLTKERCNANLIVLSRLLDSQSGYPWNASLYPHSSIMRLISLLLITTLSASLTKARNEISSTSFEIGRPTMDDKCFGHYPSNESITPKPDAITD